MFDLFIYLQCLFYLLLFCYHPFTTALCVLWDLFFFILFGYCGLTGVIISFIIPQNIKCDLKLKFARGEGELFRDLIQLIVGTLLWAVESLPFCLNALPFHVHCHYLLSWILSLGVHTNMPFLLPY